MIDGVAYEGYVAYPTSAKVVAAASAAAAPVGGGGANDSSAPAAAQLVPVLVAHQWMGLGAMEQFRAEEMAGFGFFAFALDVYGKGVRPDTPAAASAASGALKADVPEFHKRIDAGVAQLLSAAPRAAQVAVNASAALANGYCFGGVMVLELARTGQMLAVASFHGELGNITSQDDDRFSDTAAVQVHHADLDFSGAAGLLGLEDELRSQKVAVWQTAKYGNVEHGWTDPTSAKYNDQAAQQAHASMRHFYAYQLGRSYQC